MGGAAGPSLYDSGALTFAGTPGTFTPVTINPNVVVSAGTPYILFFSTVGESQSSPSAVTQWGVPGVFNDVYPGGDLLFSNNSSSYTDPWDSFFGTGSEFVFKANIAVPGPLPLAGAAAAYGWSRRIRRRTINSLRPSSEA